MIRTFFLTLFIFLPLLAGHEAMAGIRTEGQAITYADFQYVNYVATSQTKVYFATTNGIIIYNKGEARWEDPLTGAEGMPDTDVKRIWVDRFDQRLFAETPTGIYEYNFTFESWSSAGEVPTLDSDDHHLKAPEVLFPPFGFNYLGNGTMVDAEGRSFTISDIVDDGAGNLWIGTWGYGPATSSSTAKLVSLLSYGLLQNPAYTLLDQDSILWVTGPILNSRRTGISGFNREDNSFTYIETGVTPDFPVADINCLEGSSKYLYVGTANGLYLLDREKFHVVKRVDRVRGLADDNIISLQACGDDSLFIGTAGGLLLYRPSIDSIGYLYSKQFFNRIIYDMALADSFLWIASNIGAFRLDIETGKLQKYQDPDMILFTHVYDVYHYDHYMWLSSDNGLVRVDLTTGKTEPYRITSRKIDSRAIAVNDRLAVVASGTGITFIFLDKGTLQTRDFTTDDGLASNYVYSLLFDGDYLWVGTDRGVTRFLWNNPHRVD